MKRYAILASAILLTCIAAGVFYKFSAPLKRAYHTQSAKAEVKELTDSGSLHDGDIIFQTSLSSQSKAIQVATHSPYSHCGIIYKEANQYYVFEAVQPVKRTPLASWIARGKDEHFVIKRLKNADTILTPRVKRLMLTEGKKMAGKNYDSEFNWNDDRIYCSELIWKVYKRSTGLEIGKVEHLRDFDLSNKLVMNKLIERYGNKLPMDEPVISPASIFNSPLLDLVAQN